jgi:TetR/AcrR family fatty acid metabolism transcriptional regulator
MSATRRTVRREAGKTRSAETTAALSARQEELVRQAYKLFGRKGIAKTTLQDVADAAGVSKASVVYYFGTKEGLALRTVEWVLERVATRVTSAIALEESPEGKVRAMIDAIFVDPVQNRRFYITYTDLVGESSRNVRFNRLSTSFRAIVNESYAAVIRSGRGGAFGVRDAGEAATAVRAIIDGFFLQWLGEPDWRASHAAYKDACTRTVLAYLRAGS